MRILITGGAGFIGSHIAKSYVQKGHQVAVLDNLSVGKKRWIPEECQLFKTDLNNAEEVESVINKFKPDVVNHHAAHNDSMDSLEEPVKDAKNNITGSISLLEIVRKHDIQKVIYASSGGLSYGEPEKIPTTEDHNIKPSYPYGISKHTVEHYLELYNQLYGLKFNVLRYGSVYGPRATGGVIKNFLESAKKNENPTIFGDGTQTRDFVHVKDIVKANELSLKNNSGIYNIGTMNETSINDLWTLCAEVTDSVLNPEYKDRWTGDIDRCKLDYSKAQKELGWSPEISLRTGLEKTWKNIQ
jgi:UDP-glucose 4-epimerase